ncbi:MAG: hypothetical protein U1A77_19225 [Pirellulales bacterium]
MAVSPSLAQRRVVTFPVTRVLLSGLARLKKAATLKTVMAFTAMSLTGAISVSSLAVSSLAVSAVVMAPATVLAQMEGMPPMPPMDPPPMDPPPMDTPPMDTPPMDPPPMTMPPMDTPPMDPPPPPPMDMPPMDMPPMDMPPMDMPPPMDTPPMDTPPMDTPPMEDPPFFEGGLDGSGIMPPPMPLGTEMDPFISVALVGPNYKIITETWMESTTISNLTPIPEDPNFSIGTIDETTHFGTRHFGYQCIGIDWILVDVTGSSDVNKDVDYQTVEKTTTPWFEYIFSNDLVHENRMYYVTKPAAAPPGAAPVDADWGTSSIFQASGRFWNSIGAVTQESELEWSSTMPGIQIGYITNYTYLPTGQQIVKTTYSLGFNANGEPIQVTSDETIGGP